MPERSTPAQQIRIFLTARNVQTKWSKTPKAFVGEEFSEWLRLRAIPAMQQAAHENFRAGKHDWFDDFKYKQMQDALGMAGDRACYMLSLDCDGRHACSDFWGLRDATARKVKGYKMRDRRDIPQGERGWIDMGTHQLVPSAKRVPDTIQQPIECFFGVIKRKVRCVYQDDPQNGWQAMLRAINSVFNSDWCRGLTFERYWDHAEVALRVFSGLRHEQVQIGLIKYAKCTHGGWVPAELAG